MLVTRKPLPTIHATWGRGDCSQTLMTVFHQPANACRNVTLPNCEMSLVMVFFQQSTNACRSITFPNSEMSIVMICFHQPTNACRNAKLWNVTWDYSLLPPKHLPFALTKLLQILRRNTSNCEVGNSCPSQWSQAVNLQGHYRKRGQRWRGRLSSSIAMHCNSINALLFRSAVILLYPYSDC